MRGIRLENKIRAGIADATKRLQQNYEKQQLFDVAVGGKVPSREAILMIVEELRKLTFPGFFGRENLAYEAKENFAGHTLPIIYEKLMYQIKLALAYENQELEEQQIRTHAEDLTLSFIRQIPDIQDMLLKDVEAQFDGDPAAKGKEEVIFSYPGLYAVFVYRYAHALYQLKVPFIPRIMTEHAHGKTGIDINPGAEIGDYFFIDHGTGIVIGETTVIGSHVKLYQGVTLGALSTKGGQSLSGVKRHPTIEDNVVIYANTTILGGETVIGENAVVAGNTFVTESIPANTKAASTMPKLQLKNKNRRRKEK